ncbi:DUF4157 domain-containing protein [Caldilinea sp.]|jgi:hypothetical protein|uniref:eCIS core domain-containing protein n=1 Tax=Caldilinea sp. TaxID=2293560 RepID=UPI001B1BAE76|nr:DUF4157 domain-containing protein [Caldilinea sp.]MBO9392136.1 DUF4157 domain-containing protein [Caldilinea sp.]
MSQTMPLQSAKAPATTRPAAGHVLQRKCACGREAGPAGECAECRRKRLPRRIVQPKLIIHQPGDRWEREADYAAEAVMHGKQPRLAVAAASSMTPPAPLLRNVDPGSAAVSDNVGLTPMVERAVQSPGQPLAPATQQWMERRFGHNFGQVRVHTDARAAASARRLNALAYTVGHDIVFREGAYHPDTADGAHLLAHELAHVVQQKGMLPAQGDVLLQRACAATPCPPVLVPVPAVNPLYRDAEKCIQDTYATTHPNSKPGISLGFNKGWMTLKGKDVAERQALNCLLGGDTKGAGPNFTAKSGMYAGEPDLWDFANRTMYEITTASGLAFRVGKLAAEIKLANDITGGIDCGNMMFSTGSWAPPGPCYTIRPDLYMTVMNDSGVLVYQIYKESSKELTLAVLLALMAATLKKGAGAGGAKAAAGAAGKRLVPAYAIASLTAAVVLLASGRAEAKIGPGTEEPIAQLFEALAQKGTPVPPEIQEMIDADPALKAKLEQALRSGNVEKTQEELNEQILKILADNKDQLSSEDLELILGTVGSANTALPKGPQTLEEVRKLAEAAKQRQGAKPASGQEATGEPKGTGEGQKSPTEPSQSGTGEADVGGKLSEGSRQKIASSPAPAQALFKAMVGAGKTGLPLEDAMVDRFFAEFSDLTMDESKSLQARLRQYAGESFDTIIANLHTALSELRHPGEKDKQPATDKRPEAPSGDQPVKDDAAQQSGGATTQQTATPIDFRSARNSIVTERRTFEDTLGKPPATVTLPAKYTRGAGGDQRTYAFSLTLTKVRDVKPANGAKWAAVYTATAPTGVILSDKGDRPIQFINVTPFEVGTIAYWPPSTKGSGQKKGVTQKSGTTPKQ